jgi:hypothetical protein
VPSTAYHRLSRRTVYLSFFGPQVAQFDRAMQNFPVFGDLESLCSAFVCFLFDFHIFTESKNYYILFQAFCKGILGNTFIPAKTGIPINTFFS